MRIIPRRVVVGLVVVLALPAAAIQLSSDGDDAKVHAVGPGAFFVTWRDGTLGPMAYARLDRDGNLLAGPGVVD